MRSVVVAECVCRVSDACDGSGVLDGVECFDWVPALFEEENAFLLEEKD